MASCEKPTKGRRVRLRFFWQLIAAFAVVILLVGAGMFIAGRMALYSLARFGPMPTSTLWADRLASYYEAHGSWVGVEALIETYPCGADWGPWDEGWDAAYLLAGVDGTVIAASEDGSDGSPARVGTSLSPAELALAAPVNVSDEQIGYLYVSPLHQLRIGFTSLMSHSLRGFLIAGVGIGGTSLLLGFLISRRMTRPLTRLTEATRAVASGNMEVRVPEDHPGELGELASAFNRMAEDLSRADRLRKDMTADVAHELRTPLAVIRGKLEGVVDGVYPATADHLEPVIKETELLTHLVEDLRVLALAEAGQLNLDIRPTSVGDLLRDAAVNFGPQADDRGVTLALSVPADLPEVSADPRRIAQVLGNLLTNALRHTPAGGTVTMSARAGDGTVELAVADTGTGIPEEDIPYVFERFWRGEKSRSRAAGGSGLGLAIAKQLVELHGSAIGVDSAPGHGSTFRFTLAFASEAS
jgi:signal transduction histidine kinase